MQAEQIAKAEYERRKRESKTPSIGQIEAALLLADVHLQRKELDAARTLLDEASRVLKPGQNNDSVLMQSVRQRLAVLDTVP